MAGVDFEEVDIFGSWISQRMLLKGSFAVRIRLYLAPVLRSCSASGAIRFLKWSTTVSAFFAPSLAESSSLIGDIGSGVGEEEDT